MVRRTEDKMIGGVAGGVADFFGLDPTLVRVVFVVLAVFGGGGLLVYLVMWVIVPTAENVALPPGDVARSNVDDMVGQARRAASDVRKSVQRDRSQSTDPSDPPGSDAGEGTGTA